MILAVGEVQRSEQAHARKYVCVRVCAGAYVKSCECMNVCKGGACARVWECVQKHVRGAGVCIHECAQVCTHMQVFMCAW